MDKIDQLKNSIQSVTTDLLKLNFLQIATKQMNFCKTVDSVNAAKLKAMIKRSHSISLQGYEQTISYLQMELAIIENNNTTSTEV